MVAAPLRHGLSSPWEAAGVRWLVLDSKKVLLSGSTLSFASLGKFGQSGPHS